MSATSRLAAVRATICLSLAVLVFTVYGQTVSFDFLNYDDHLHIRNNPIVSRGISSESLWWAFSSVYGANWCPLTWISHMLDVQFFGMNPGMHHLTSTAIHAVNSILLFLLLGMMTGSVWRSAAVAGLFAVHPLHVESVAWISERKDVLSTLFWFLTMAAYVWYCRKRSLKRYLLVATFFGLGLMAKPMLVTLPFVLLLMDFWPLRRIRLSPGLEEAPGDNVSNGAWQNWRRLVREKIPLLALSLISSGVTIYAQNTFGAVDTLAHLSLGRRLGNALCSWVLYLWKTVWPVDLAVFYPYPETLSLILVIASGLTLAALTALALWGSRKFPYLAVGWLWFLGTLVPMIGIVQVGAQSMADRYTYVPLIGIFIAASWGVHDLTLGWRHRPILYGLLMVVVFPVLTTLAWNQTSNWKDSISLFTHALAVTDANYLAHNNLGKALFDQGRTGEALTHFEEALRIRPSYDMAHDNMAGVLIGQKKYDEAFIHYSESLRLKPGAAKSHYNIGYVLNLRGDPVGAAGEYREAMRIDPVHADAHNNLGLLMEAQGSAGEAERLFIEATKLSPGSIRFTMNLVNLYRKQKRYEEALLLMGEALRKDSTNPTLICVQAGILGEKGSTVQAQAAYKKALLLDPDSLAALYGLAVLSAREGSYERAAGLFQRIRVLKPEDPDPCYNLACLYALRKNEGEAVKWLSLAVERGFRDWDLLAKDKDLSNIRDTDYYKSLPGPK